MPNFGFIAGAHRSGTTWVGQVMGTAQNCTVLHEPFNLGSGIRGVKHWYPAAGSEVDKVYYKALINDLTSGCGQYKNSFSGDPKWKSYLRSKLGGRNHWQYKNAFRFGVKNLILKDPFLTRLSPSLCNDFNMRGIILIRQPASYLYSIKRMGWGIPNLEFNDCSLIHSVPQCSKEFARQVGMFWHQIYSAAQRYEQHCNGAVKIIRHEDLCANPDHHYPKLFTHLNLKVTRKTLKFISKTTKGNLVTPKGTTLHNNVRDAQNIPNAWQGHLSDDELSVLYEQTGSVMGKFYPNFNIF